MNKRILVNTAIVLTLISGLFMSPVAADSPPPVPSGFNGTVKVNGVNVAAGSRVSAWINGVEYAYTEAFLFEGETYYSINVPADVDTTGDIEGGVESDTVVFQVGTLLTAPTASWHGGTSVTVNLTASSVDVPPVITEGSSVDVTMSEDGTPTAFSLALHATDADTGDTLTWSIYTPADHGTAGASGTGASPTVTFAPDADYVGTDSFVVQVSDGIFGDTITVNVTLDPFNDAPVTADIPDQTIFRGETFTTISLDDFVSDIDNADIDIAWTYTGDADLTVSITDRVATITTPDGDWTGIETITFKATDPGSLFDEDTVTFKVRLTNAPVVTDIPDQIIIEGSTFTTIALDDYVSDVDHTDEVIVWTFSGNTALTVSITDRVATITIPDENWFGVETITFRATDPDALFDEDPATFTVTSENDTPFVGDIPSQTVAEGGAFTSINVDEFVSDLDNDDAEMSWTWSGNTDLSVSIVEGVATITTPDENWHGSETITFRATDPLGAYDEDGATFTVTPMNDAPVVADIPDQEIAEGATFTTINLDDYVSDVDNTEAEMTWLYTGNTALGVSITGRVATITTPDENWYGAETITFRATDPLGAYDEDGSTFTVTPVNDVPVVSDIPDLVVMRGGSFAFLNLDDYVLDVDNTDLDLVWTYLGNTELIVTISSNRVVEVKTPDINWTGVETITFKATDPGLLYSEDTVTFSVVNFSPPDKELLTSGNVSFNWDDIAGANLYYIQLSLYENFKTLLLNTITSESSYEYSKALTNGTTYYWRISPRYGTTWGTWLDDQSFIFPRPPTVPVLLLPASNALVTDVTPKLDWKTVTVPAGTTFARYELEVATDSAFVNKVSLGDPELTNIALSEHTLAESLSPNTKYYWRVRAVGKVGELEQYSAWSAVRYFRVVMEPPVLKLPENALVPMLDNKRPVFEWWPVADASSYYIQISKVPTFSSVVKYATVTTTNYALTIDLTANTTYYWRVKANGPNGPSAYSDKWQFKTGNPPSVPALVSPAANALVTSTPSLDWGTVTVPTGTMFDRYELQYTMDLPNIDLVEPIRIPSLGGGNPLIDSVYTGLSGIIANTKYYWRVRAVGKVGDVEQYSAYSAVRYFRVVVEPPTLSLPENVIDPVLDNKRPVFEWESVPGATSYYIQISKYPNFSSLVKYATVTGTSYALTADLTANTIYYWRVRETGTNWEDAWSEVGEFKTGNPLSVPALVSPATNALVTKYPLKLDWRDVTVPVGGVKLHRYHLQLATDSKFTTIVLDIGDLSDEDDIKLSDYTISAGALSPNMKYYWRVRAYDLLEQHGAWSAVRYFRTVMETPALYSPASGSTVYNIRPYLDWGIVNGATSYYIQISKYSNFSKVLKSATVTGSSYYISTINLPKGVKLYWRVRANGVNGPSLYSGTGNFIIQ